MALGLAILSGIYWLSDGSLTPKKPHKKVPKATSPQPTPPTREQDGNVAVVPVQTIEADEAFAQARYRVAQTLYLAALSSAPQEPILHHKLGLTQAKLAEFEHAGSSLKTAMILDPDRTDFQADWIDFLLLTLQPESARDYIRSLPANHSSDLQIQTLLLRALTQAGQTDAARELAETLVAPNNTTAKIKPRNRLVLRFIVLLQGLITKAKRSTPRVHHNKNYAQSTS